MDPAAIITLGGGVVPTASPTCTSKVVFLSAAENTAMVVFGGYPKFLSSSLNASIPAVLSGPGVTIATGAVAATRAFAAFDFADFAFFAFYHC
jgi:hypothetical protein